MGSVGFDPEERLVHQGLSRECGWIARLLSCAEFAALVAETGYVTTAEHR
jgi:hypothetical protein